MKAPIWQMVGEKFLSNIYLRVMINFIKTAILHLMTQSVELKSGNTICRGVLYEPKRGEGNGAGIVLAHGFAGTIDSGLLEYAEGFAKAGFHALAFDYRGFGLSDGAPRQHISVPQQREDWRAAITHLRTHEAVDADRIGLWGISFSGGHVIYLAHEDDAIRGLVAQVPAVDAHLNAMLGNYKRGAEASEALIKVVKKDLKDSFLGGQHNMLAVAPEANKGPAILGASEAQIYPKIAGETWHNRVTARSLLTGKFELNNATELSDVLTTPMLLQISVDDETVSNESIKTFARRCGSLATLKQYDGGHFSLLQTPGRQQALDDAVTFFQSQLIL